ncbi:McrC family protein [Egicoccus sp. AB-alg2]|uniref:McrC family protein n=1 Tax=Egicoccus sp. AB-alg2 TaxID=3242693 RepID=UPI00359F06A9
MRRLTLREYRREPGVELSTTQRDALSTLGGVDVRPTPGQSGAYDLTPGSTVGTLVVDGLQVDLRPKIPLDRVLFLVSYALDPVRWHEQRVGLDERATLVEAMALLWLSGAQQALRRGPLQGYQRREEALPTVRGRIRIGDQVRTRHGLVPPVEVTYDEFTTDIEENRLLDAAAVRVARLPLRGRTIRDRLAGVLAHLDDVPFASYDVRRLPAIRFTRLNRHYRTAVELSKLVLSTTSVELGGARREAGSFLVDMNAVFEHFLFTALVEAMPRTSIVHERRIHLDRDRRVAMKPDLTWLEGQRPVFVADAKYKALRDRDGRHADLYQLLAYVVTLGLERGLLVYAAGEGEPGHHEVVELGRSLHVAWLDLSGQPADILASVADLASRIQQLTTAVR